MWSDMSKGIELLCLDRAVNTMKNMLDCDDCAEVYVDYNPLRYPYISLYIILAKCNSAIEYCEDQLYDIVVELTTTIDAVGKNLVELDKDVVYLRIKCGEGWLEYGYAIPKAQGIPYIIRGFTVIYHGKKIFIESVDQSFIDILNKTISLLIVKAGRIMDLEGLI